LPLCSVVVPAHNRPDELRRALRSVASQSLPDLECIVVDDASTQPIQCVVEEFDERFSCLRRNVNGGPTAARMSGLERAQGELVMSLDSDNELFPWALERAAHYLHVHPGVDAAIGLLLFPDGLRLRVGEGVKVVSPEEFSAVSSLDGAGDSVPLVRREVVTEWLRLSGDYFVTEFVFTLSLFLRHSALYVDEPWGRFHIASHQRVSANQRDPRRYQDIETFIADLRPLIGTSPCRPLDAVLVNMWAQLVRAHRRREAAVLAEWMRERGISTWTAATRKLAWAARRRIRAPWARSHPRVHVL
jgi:glycosyltransferase involved in cell wall biosynthesis